MEMRVVGVAGGELAVSDVDGFVGLALGTVRVKHDVLFGGDRVPAQALARFEVVAKALIGRLWVRAHDTNEYLNSMMQTAVYFWSRAK